MHVDLFGLPTSGNSLRIRAGAIAAFTLLCTSARLPAQPVAVRQLEGEVRGFLVLRDSDGRVIANGDSIQTTRGAHISNRLVFHFKDGSMQDESVIFTQKGHFRVLSDHLVQKGPAFRHGVDLSIDAFTGMVPVSTTDDKGQEKVESSRMKLPADLANGIVPVILKNLAPGAQSITESMAVASPKPLLIKLAITAEGEDSFSTGSAAHKATRYDIKVDITLLRGSTRLKSRP